FQIGGRRGHRRRKKRRGAMTRVDLRDTRSGIATFHDVVPTTSMHVHVDESRKHDRQDRIANSADVLDGLSVNAPNLPTRRTFVDELDVGLNKALWREDVSVKAAHCCTEARKSSKWCDLSSCRRRLSCAHVSKDEIVASWDRRASRD